MFFKKKKEEENDPNSLLMDRPLMRFRKEKKVNYETEKTICFCDWCKKEVDFYIFLNNVSLVYYRFPNPNQTNDRVGINDNICNECAEEVSELRNRVKENGELLDWICEEVRQKDILAELDEEDAKN